MVHSAFQAQRAFLLMASHYQQPQEVRVYPESQGCLGNGQCKIENKEATEPVTVRDVPKMRCIALQVLSLIQIIV